MTAETWRIISKKVRAALDKAGLKDCSVVVSNSVDEYLIHSLNTQKARIDSYGVGERLITAKSDPVFGGVYKLAAIQKADGTYEPKIKISENVEKITNPGKKALWRLYDPKTGYGVADLITLYDEEVNEEEPFPFL